MFLMLDALPARQSAARRPDVCYVLHLLHPLHLLLHPRAD
jgi:hypothetical protein